MLTSLLLALAQTATPAPAETPQRDIVVTGKRLDATERALKECIARACPPDQEIAAALAHAENQFVNGDYNPARSTLWQTIGRVDRHAKDYPTQVASMWRAESRISAHLGLSESMQSSQFQSVDALRAGLPKGSDAVLQQRLEVADTFVKRGQIDMGRYGYRDVAGEAKRRNLHGVRGYALLRLVTLESVAAQINPAVYGSSLRTAVREVLATREPELEQFRGAARLIYARFKASQGDTAELDAIAADYATKPSTRPALLWQPLFEYRGTLLDPENPPKALGENWFEGQWADVGFVIGADGRVKDVDILRESPTLKRDWLTPVMSGIAKRRYAAAAVPPGLDGLRRVERYTLTAFKEVQLGSRIQNRAAPRVEMLDLTAEPAKAPPAG